MLSSVPNAPVHTRGAERENPSSDNSSATFDSLALIPKERQK